MRVSKWSFLLLALLLGGQAQGQRITDWGRQIEAVHSVAGAQTLLDSVYRINKDHRGSTELDSLQLDLRERCAGCGVTIPPTWQKADIDGDGKTDLLICTGDQNVVIFNREAAPPLVRQVPLSRSSRGLCRTVTLARRHGKPVLEGWEIDEVDNRDPEYGPPMYRHYVLTYQLGFLIDYVAQPRWWLPRAIELSSYNGYPGHNYRSYYRIKLKSGEVEARDGLLEDSTDDETVHYQLRAGQLDTLRQRLRYLRVSGLLRRYSNDGVFDASKQSMKFCY
ncbi:hypothetical protein EJV47_15190 [Hymenobacter gummosus]|uniref:VCBS repeat-containing protein n=1 Tax=Hymenobacter gummosus TaxID=1776032 RepID=A0A431U1J8_9BACT|nr:hypothetical protein [Hymenobacter gummosus]RTQ48936.1 hypothetical protein EJV47_15190 [Hymenobacter gummosus]